MLGIKNQKRRALRAWRFGFLRLGLLAGEKRQLRFVQRGMRKHGGRPTFTSGIDLDDLYHSSRRRRLVELVVRADTRLFLAEERAVIFPAFTAQWA
jgi:hypothetical protein